MSDPNTLEILIRTIAQQEGLELTDEGVQKLKDHLLQAGAGGADAADKVTGATDHMSFRVGRNMEQVAASFLSVDNPLGRILQRLEFVGYMAQRSGVSIIDLLAKFGPMILVAVSVGAVAEQLQGVADAGKKALEEQGLGSRGWLENLRIGLGYARDLNGELEKTVDIGGRIEAFFKKLGIQLQRIIEDAGQPPSEKTKLQREAEDIRAHQEEIQKGFQDRGAEVEAKRKAAAGLEGAELQRMYEFETGKRGLGGEISSDEMRRELEQAYEIQKEDNDKRMRAAAANARDKLKANAEAQARLAQTEAAEKKLYEEKKAQIDLEEAKGQISKKAADLQRAYIQQAQAVSDAEKIEARAAIARAEAALGGAPGRGRANAPIGLPPTIPEKRPGTGTLITPESMTDAVAARLAEAQKRADENSIRLLNQALANTDKLITATNAMLSKSEAQGRELDNLSSRVESRNRRL